MQLNGYFLIFLVCFICPGCAKMFEPDYVFGFTIRLKWCLNRAFPCKCICMEIYNTFFNLFGVE